MPVVVIAAAEADPGRVGALRDAGVDVVLRRRRASRSGSLRASTALGERDVQSLFVEGGADLAGVAGAAGRGRPDRMVPGAHR